MIRKKNYASRSLTFLSAILYNLRWIGVLLIIVNIPWILKIIDKATSVIGLSSDYDEVLLWGGLLIACTIILFIFRKPWEKICDKLTDKLDK